MATLVSTEQMKQNSGAPGDVAVPAPTAWPLVLAFGFTLVFAGLLTSASVSILGAGLAVAGCVGWFGEVFPHEHEEVVPVVPREVPIATKRRVVERHPAPRAVQRALAFLPQAANPGAHGHDAGQRV